VQVLERLTSPTRTGPDPPGPRSLQFVEGNFFTCISSTVILLNILLLFYEAAHHETADNLNWLNRLFLLFYTVELVLKATLWRNLFLCGPCDLVKWHVLDLIIVLGGLLDLVVMPLFPHSGSIKLLSALRALRLARLLKLVHNFLVADTTWAESEQFQVFVMALIALSSLVMGLECDWPELTEFMEAIYWEQVVLAIFTLELAVRLKNAGLRFFCDRTELLWNWLDFMVVVGGILDQWFVPALSFISTMIKGKPASGQFGKIGHFIVILRMARLLRVLRLVRLVRQVPQLFNLLSGIAQAMAGMVWVLVLTIVVLYFFALLSVKLFRDGLVFNDNPPEDVAEIFNSVPDSIFVLFTVMDGHKSILDPLLNSLPITKVVFMIFVMISEWAMLSILTAVVSENMIAVTEARKQEQESAEQVDKEKEKADELNDIFTHMDLNKDGAINLMEFDAMLKNDETRSALCQACSLTVMDLRLMFNILEKNGFVNRKDFIQACNYESRAVSERSLMKLEKRLAGVEEKISTTVLIVEGASIESVNGTYVEHGVHNLKPFYKKMGQSGAIIYFDFFWKMNDTDDTTTWLYHMKDRTAYTTRLINHSTWAANSPSSGKPPHVKWESHHILDKRIEYLEGLVVETHRDIRMLTARMMGGRTP